MNLCVYMHCPYLQHIHTYVCIVSYVSVYCVYSCVQQKAKAEITAMEMTYGSNPGSPTKRKATATTPTKLPPKIRKVCMNT